ncbi:hypothetical protein LBMAG56_11400 [Verrucomicrobiota bacterium]|nr:hypothetical protein LBMAG56_11400 [Verrucomicrobiota bacterium]
MQVWADYDPNKGDFKEEIISEETKDGIYHREFYISAFVLGEDVRVYCKYSVKAGVTKAPGLLNVRGWMSWPGINVPFVKEGWACLSFDYCGKTGDRKHYTSIWTASVMPITTARPVAWFTTGRWMANPSPIRGSRRTMSGSRSRGGR